MDTGTKIMIAIVLAATLVLQDTPQKSEADLLFSKMITKYSAAKTVRGSVEFLQTAVVDGVQRRVQITTNVLFEAPNKFRIAQTDPARGVSFLAISDGKQICYSAPQDWVERGRPRIYEPATADMAANLEAFAILLPDRSFPVGLSLYSTKEIKFTVYRLRNLKIAGEAAVGNANAQVIRATYLIDDGVGKLPASVTIADFYVTSEGDLLRITRSETVGGGQMRDQSGKMLKQESFKVTNEWLVNMRFDEPADASLFQIPR